MRIQVLLFAAAKEAAGSNSIEIEVSDRPRASDVLKAIASQLPQLDPLLPSCRLAVDCCYVTGDAPIERGSEIALIPPVSGG